MLTLNRFLYTNQRQVSELELFPMKAFFLINIGMNNIPQNWIAAFTHYLLSFTDITQQTFTCLKSTIEILENNAKFVQS